MMSMDTVVLVGAAMILMSVWWVIKGEDDD